ncbi:nucleotide sugar dehydrogenase [Candidatus Bathyarchaeota archaeon]|nr:nucleotide sugar dehydrogenase [Candidatus Bathyarchaeota archaeon]
MSTSTILHIKPEELESSEKRGIYTITIVGCEPTGVLHAYLFAEAGFKVIWAEPDQTVVDLLTKKKMLFSNRETDTKFWKHTRNGRLSITGNIKTAVVQSDVIGISTPINIDERRKPNHSNLERICKLVGSNIRKGSLIIMMAITGLGTMEDVLRPIVENTSGLKIGTDIGLAYSPMRISDEQTLEAAVAQERIVAATDKNSLSAASTILKTISRNEIKKTNNVKLAEAVFLFETVQRDTRAALANELALFCEKANIDYLEAQEFMNKNASCETLAPTIAVGSPQEEPYLLLENAENLNAKLRITLMARETNEEMVKHAVNLTRDALGHCGKTLKRSKISLLGVSQRLNEKNSPRKVLKELARMLEARGAKLNLYDPHSSNNETTEMQHHLKGSLNEAVDGADCVLIVTKHDQFKRLNLRKLKIMMRSPSAIVDLEGVLDPHKVEKEGIIYRGLGRGVWTK